MNEREGAFHAEAIVHGKWLNGHGSPNERTEREARVAGEEGNLK